MAKTLTLRLSDGDAELIEWLKDSMLINTASRALLEAAARYRAQAAREKELREEIAHRKERMRARRVEVSDLGNQVMRLGSLMASEARTWDAADNGQQSI